MIINKDKARSENDLKNLKLCLEKCTTQKFVHFRWYKVLMYILIVYWTLIRNIIYIYFEKM